MDGPGKDAQIALKKTSLRIECMLGINVSAQVFPLAEIMNALLLSNA